jgi:deoxyuridine 5'-triphosphate nucleotidohydrolase
MNQYYISGIFLATVAEAKGEDVFLYGRVVDKAEKILRTYKIGEKQPYPLDSVKQYLYSSWENTDLEYDNFIYMLQGFIDLFDLYEFHVLYFPLCLKKYFDKYISIPYTLIDDDCLRITRQCNVFDLLDIIYKKPVTQYHAYSNYNKFINSVECNIRVVDDNAIVPNKVRLSDVGYDLTIINKHKQLNSTTALYDTGIQIQVPFGYYTEIVPRSSLSKSGYMLSNSMGIIDNSYTGNLYVALTKVAPEVPEIEFPFKCCQLILKNQHFMNINVQYDELESTHRKDGGFGSTN